MYSGNNINDSHAVRAQAYWRQITI